MLCNLVTTYLRLISDEEVIDLRFIGNWSPNGFKVVSKRALSFGNGFAKVTDLSAHYSIIFFHKYSQSSHRRSIIFLVTITSAR